MSMREIQLGFRLDFSTEELREDSEDILLRILGINSRLNLMYLHRNPETPLLYDSGVVYTAPDQLDGRPPLKRGDVKQLTALMQKMGASPETAAMVVRIMKGIEIFLDTPTLYARGRGDCNELVPVRVAELWRAGVTASPYLMKQPNTRGGWTYHAQVLHPDGSSEDPSLILGMGGPARAAERREEIRKNAERIDNYVAAGKQLVAEGQDPAVVEERIRLMGFAPKTGTFADPYKEAA